MKYYIITGTSSGIGEALVEHLIVKKNKLFCISRNENEKLINEAKKADIFLKYYKFDLSHVNEINNLVVDIFAQIDKKDAEAIYLINNAGVLNPIKPIEYCQPNEIVNNLNVNLIAPMILTSSFISYLKDFEVDKRIINISSGAGKKPYYGWSNYCGSKAGLDLFTGCVGLEQEREKYPVKIISIAPGVVDTNMQKEIRSTSEEYFPDVNRFKALKNEGKLFSSDKAAEYILKLIDDKRINQGDVLDIRDFL